MSPIRPIALAVCCAVAATTAATTAVADEVVLNDGSRLQGKVLRLDEAGLQFKTSFAGDLTIKREAVRSLITDDVAVVQLSSGDRVIGRLGLAGDTQVMQSQALGTVPLPDNSLAAVWRQGDESPTDVVARHQQEKIQKALDEASADWSGSISAGFTGTSGTKDRVSSNARADAELKSAENLVALYMDGRFAEENGSATESEIRAGARLEHDISDGFFTFGEVKLERDGIEDLELRTTLSAGLGYNFIDRPGHSLKGRAGVGFEQESYEDGANDSEIVLSLGYTWKRRINGTMDFVHELDYLPAAADPGGNFRINSRAALELPVGKEDTWKLKLGLRNQYDSEPQPGVEELDTTYFINLGFAFD